MPRLTPIKSDALAAMLRAPLVGAWGEGWRDAGGREFNSHTVGYLAQLGLAAFSRDRTQVMITRFGRAHLEQEAQARERAAKPLRETCDYLQAELNRQETLASNADAERRQHQRRAEAAEAEVFGHVYGEHGRGAAA
jgi:hypothetical protein